MELKQLVEINDDSGLEVTFEDNSTETITGEEGMNAKLVLIGQQINLVFSDSSRSQWITGEESIEVNS